MTSNPINILLVDDEPRNLEVLESLLQSPEYRFVRALNAEEALLALLQGEFAVIVLDVQMPGTSGIELAHLIKQRERTQHIPIIFLTAFYDDERRMLESYNVGAVDYLTKPANSQVLRSKVAVFVDLHRKTAALQASNAALEKEIAQRSAAEQALRETNDALEFRVEARTAALRDARDVAERAGRAKDNFLAALSHELRTPLNPVLLLASEAEQDPAFPEKARAHFTTIRRNVELEARLIDDLLDLTRITHGKMSIDIKPVDLHRVVADAVATVRADIERKRIAFKMDLDPRPCQVSADPVRLQQVFWNVLKNAIKFTPARGGSIAITGKTDEGAETIAVSIADNGVGLSPLEMERIYDAFAQGDHATPGGAHRFGGLGLGLTISKSLVELHGGRLIAKSGGTDQGATFVVELPLLPQGAGEDAPAASAGDEVAAGVPPAKPGFQRRKVLLVEDHEPSRAALAALLKSRHYEVSLAGSVGAARSLIASQDFDFLISDIGLPDGDGFELMKEMRGMGDVRGIALTGYGMVEDIDRSRSAGFRVHLTKPILAASLDQALAEAQR